MNEVGDLQFIDTNILIYAHDLSAGEKNARARELIESLLRRYASRGDMGRND